MWGIGAGVGKEAVDGAMKRFGEILSGFDPSKINEGLSGLGGKIPILGVLIKGYEAMSESEKAEFAKNIMLAGASLAAKNGGKVSF